MASVLSSTEINTRVVRGARHFDDQRKNWFKGVKIELLNVGSDKNSPGAQVFGEGWVDAFTIKDAIALGLIFPGQPTTVVEYANKVWRAQARFREQGATPTTT